MNIDFINLWNHRRVIDLDVNVDIKGPQLKYLIKHLMKNFKLSNSLINNSFSFNMRKKIDGMVLSFIMLLIKLI